MRALIFGLLPVALMAGCSPTGSDAPAQANEEVAASPDEVTSDEVTADEVTAGNAATVADDSIDRSHKGEAPPTLTFESPSGQPVTVADLTAGPTLVNLWATWCAPCVAELPALDALAASSKDKLRVIAISQDLDGAAKVLPFLADHHIQALEPYRDPKAALSVAYRANLPTTILYGRDGREVWRVTGAVDWGSESAKALIAEAG